MCLAVVEEGEHLLLCGAVEELAILAQHRVGVCVLVAPVGACGEVNEEVIEADAGLVEILPHGQPDVLAIGNAFCGIHAVHDGACGIAGQIPAAISEGIVFKDEQGL